MTEVIKVEDCGDNIGDYDIPFHNAIIIPKGATNGDVLKAMYPNAECKREQDVVYFDINTKGEIWFSSLFDIAWWDATYEGGKEDNDA